MNRISNLERSVIPACDVKAMSDFERLIEKTHIVQGIGGYKVGAVLTIRYGLPELVKTVRRYTTLPVIYDHQKAMTDIPDLGKDFVESVKNAGADALIGFPQSGYATEEAWIKACNDLGLAVIIGGEMTHPKYRRSEGGYIADDALDEMYLNAAKLGVNNFVVPGNKADRVNHYRELLLPVVGDDLTLWAPGFVAQKGEISETGKVAGKRWHAIVGRGIYGAPDIEAAAREMTSKLFE